MGLGLIWLIKRSQLRCSQRILLHPLIVTEIIIIALPPAFALHCTVLTLHSTTGTMMATNGSTQPTCQNCSTSTTPLWRRDEFGSVLCNACGLFLKLHGRPRPISLKTDVIKSRNRVKTMRPDLAKQKKVGGFSPDPNARPLRLILRRH